MRIAYFGTSVFAIPALRALAVHGYTLPVVVTQPDRPAGRGARLTPSPVKLAAEELHLPVLQPESCRTPDFLEVLRGYTPDLTVVAAYGQFLPDALRTLPHLGTVNLHGSLLPRYRGGAPIQRAIWQGETVTGVCLMWMAREMDAGDIIGCVEVPILPDDTAGSLTTTLAVQAADLLLHWLPAIADGTAPHLAQPPDAVTFAPVIRKEEREIDWQQPARHIARQIRALLPTPTAITHFRGDVVKVLAADALPRTHNGEPGEILNANPKEGLLVATGDGALLIRTLQPAGKRAMSSSEFLRGTPIHPRERMRDEPGA